MTEAELQAYVSRVEAACKKEGCSSIEELVSALQSAQATATQAETARDQAQDKLDDASAELKKTQRALGHDGGERAFLKKKAEELEEQVKDLEIQLRQAKSSNAEHTEKATTTTAPAPPRKSLTEELAEVEAALTDEEWQLADRALELVDDDDDAKALAYPQDDKWRKERLDILRGVKSNVALKPRPSTLRPETAQPKAPAKTGESLADQLLKKMTATSVAPQGGVVRPRVSTKKDERPTHPAFA
jgi:chromosome segregation ATPase